MSADEEVSKKPTKKLRKGGGFSRFPADKARRQGAIATLAFTEFGSRDQALDFLNSRSETLDARPIDVASASEDGFAEVQRLIRSTKI